MYSGKSYANLKFSVTHGYLHPATYQLVTKSTRPDLTGVYAYINILYIYIYIHTSYICIRINFYLQEFPHSNHLAEEKFSHPFLI